ERTAEEEGDQDQSDAGDDQLSERDSGDAREPTLDRSGGRGFLALAAIADLRREALFGDERIELVEKLLDLALDAILSVLGLGHGGPGVSAAAVADAFRGADEAPAVSCGLLREAGREPQRERRSAALGVQERRAGSGRRAAVGRDDHRGPGGEDEGANQQQQW